MSLKSVGRFSLVAASSFLVAACAAKSPLEVTVNHCPSVAVMGDMGSFTRIQGDSSLAKDVLYTATLSNVQVDCNQKDRITTQVSFDVSAVAGPAMKAGSVEVEYFIVTAKDTASLVNKQSYSVRLTFDGQGRAIASQKIEHVIPSVERARKYDYELLLGLIATPTEYYRNITR